jgi:hypothetical protein
MKTSTKIKNSINNLLSFFNLYIQKKHPGIDPEDQLIKVLNFFKINYIIDVGANTGQFCEGVYANGYNGDIISFEPLSSAYNLLILNSKKIPTWEVYKRCAIGNIDGKIKINISQNSVSSSILIVSDKHLNA